MTTHLFHKDAISDIRALMTLVETPNVVDIEEKLQLDSVKENTRLWYESNRLVAFAFVDNYNNLNFKLDPKHKLEQLFAEIVTWGVTWIERRNTETKKVHTLDASCLASDKARVRLLEAFGFEIEPVRTLKYERDLTKPIFKFSLPKGFSFAQVEGEHQVEQLVSLHRAAFGTQNMTTEERLAIIRSPNYNRSLDLLVLAPDRKLAAYCICEVEGKRKGSTDPIAVHPNHQAKGIGKALLTKSLQTLKAHDISKVFLGTSSHNKAMQSLAESVGFQVVSEKLWFAKTV